jgi:hypothetical protein
MAGLLVGATCHQLGKEEQMARHVRVWPLVWFVASVMVCGLLPIRTTHADDKDKQSIFYDSLLEHHDDADAARVRRGFAIAPVPLNLQDKSLALVGLGSYIVNAQDGCNDCHTHPSYAPGGDPFQGQPEQINIDQYLAGGRRFGPRITSANITPDADGKPAGLTFEEFRELMRTGHDPDNPSGELLQVMPWPLYSKMIGRDLRAIYEYLRAIPSLPDNPNPGP